jgi:predicted RNase H-like HicB family nuclease
VIAQKTKGLLLGISKLRQLIMKHIKIVVEKHPEGYVAYPLGIQGVVVGEGDSYEEALNDVRSAILFHVETFGRSVLESESSVLEAFVAEASV